MPQRLLETTPLFLLVLLLGGCKVFRSEPSDERGQAPGNFNSTTTEVAIPVIQSVSSPDLDGVYEAGDTVNIELTFSEPVLVIGSPKLQLNLGATTGEASYLNGSESPQLTFSYLVRTGDRIPILAYTGDRALILPDGTNIVSLEQTPADVMLPPPGSPESLSGSKKIELGIRSWSADDNDPLKGLNYI